MLSTDLMRSGAVGFGLGGVAWIVSGLLVVFGNPIVGPHPVYFLFVLVALLLTSVGLMGLHALQEGSYGRIGRVGLYAILLAFAVQALGTAGSLSGSSVLGWVVPPVGLSIKMVGFVLYGVATVRAGILPRRYGVALVVLAPVSVILLAYGNIWTGLVLMILGYGLWRRREASGR
jgi:hypothetical protein